MSRNPNHLLLSKLEMFEEWPAFDVTELHSFWFIHKKGKFEEWPAFDVTEQLPESRRKSLRLFEEWPAFDVTELHYHHLMMRCMFEEWPAFDVTEHKNQ